MSSTQTSGNEPKRVLFHASAVGLALRSEDRDEHAQQAVACSCLPAIGGKVETHANHGWSGILFYESAFTSVDGDFVSGGGHDAQSGDCDEDDRPVRTHVRAFVKGVRLDTCLVQSNAGMPSRTLAVKHADVEIESLYDRRSPVSFRSVEASIDGVEVDGKALLVDTNAQIFADGKQLFNSALQDDAFRRKCSNQILGTREDVTLGTVVKGLRWADGVPKGVSIEGHKLTVEGLGSFSFGEIYVQKGVRRLILVRCCLTPPCRERRMLIVDAYSNIQTYPPQ